MALQVGFGEYDYKRTSALLSKPLQEDTAKKLAKLAMQGFEREAEAHSASFIVTAYGGAVARGDSGFGYRRYVEAYLGYMRELSMNKSDDE